MPLMHSKSNKAFKKNVEVEMEHDKPRDQSLAIAYSIKRKAQHKKMSQGGNVESAHDEHRPMPDSVYNDHKNTKMQNDKPMQKDSTWTDRPDKVSLKGRTVPLSRPKVIQGVNFSSKFNGIEEDIPRNMPPESPDKKLFPEEEEEYYQGNSPDMSDSHSTRLKPYAKGGEIEEKDKHPMVSKYQDDLDDLPPSEDEGMSFSKKMNEKDMYKQGPSTHDLSLKMMSDGGMMDDEEAMEHHASIASAIMAKRKKMSKGGMMDDEVEDHLHTLSAKGSYADITRNADEDPNFEDDLSYDALKKENYDESSQLHDQPEDSNKHGDNGTMSYMQDEDDNDGRIVQRIKSIMKKRSPIVE